MADNKNWGNCKGCRYFGTHHPKPDDTEIARCMQPELREFDLQVSGISGCNEFEARADISGSVYEEPAPPVH